MTNDINTRAEKHLQDLYEEATTLAEAFKNGFYMLKRINDKRRRILDKISTLQADPYNYFYEQEQQILNDLRSGHVKLVPTNPTDTVRLRRYTTS